MLNTKKVHAILQLKKHKAFLLKDLQRNVNPSILVKVHLFPMLTLNLIVRQINLFLGTKAMVLQVYSRYLNYIHIQVKV